jgi:hypothetical protein
MAKIVFLDTMIYLHFKPVEDIDWLDLLGTDYVRILVPKITSSELDKHKDSHAKSKVKSRARSMLQRLEATAVGGPHELRKGVTLERFTRRPQFDFAEYDLDSSRNDDQLVASALEFKRSHPEAEVIVISGDATARLTAMDVGLKAMALPEEHQVRHEIDPAEEEIRQLRAEISRLQQTYPKLSLGFQRSEPRHLLHVTLASLPEIEVYVQRELAKVKAQYPVLSSKTPSVPANGFDIALMTERAPSPREFDRYNSERQPFFDAYEQHLRTTWDSFARQSMSFPFTLEVSNDGTAVATDVDVFTHFPDEVEVMEQSD